MVYLLKKKVGFLGYILTLEDIQPNSEHVEKIQHWNTPGNVKQVQSFWGNDQLLQKIILEY